MADQPAAASSAVHKAEFQLNIISPMASIQRLSFPSISTSCTIAELKQKISDASETRVPLPSQQRLIYRGHVLAQEERTLREIFGSETIDSSDEALTIHLVFNPSRPEGSAAPTSLAQAPTPQTPTAQSALPPQGNANPPRAPTQGLRVAPGHGPPMPFPQGQFPPQLQQTFDQLQQINQQLAAQMASLGTHPAVRNLAPGQPGQPQGQPSQSQPHPPHPHHHHPHAHVHQPQTQIGIPNMTPQQTLQQYMAQQQQARAAAGQHSMNIATQRPSSAPPPGMRNTNTVIRETIGPNGERVQSIVQTGTVQFNHQGQPNAGLLRRDPSRNDSPRSGTPTNQIHQPNQIDRPSSTPGDHAQPQPPTQLSGMQLQALQAHMSSMDAAMNLGSIPPTSIQEQARTLLQSVRPTITQEQYNILAARRVTLETRANTMQNTLDGQLHRAAEQVASQRSTQSSQDSAIYVLSSSNGPQALLISPTGNYAAPWPMAAVRATQPTRPAPPEARDEFGLEEENDNVNWRNAALINAHANAMHLAQVQANAHQQINVANVPHVHQQHRRMAAADQARDLARILLPLGGHLWLLIRLFGFVYFFTHGASWRRTILLSLVAFLLFVAQTGIFRPILQTVWNPIRRHAEALLPLAGNEPPRRGNAPAGGEVDTPGPQRRNHEPTPQEAAERILQERERQDQGLIRQGLRRGERAIALFVASLVPGVGERHIAAREAAEAARQAEEREREETARREQAEREQVEANVEISNVRAEGGGPDAGEPTGGAAPAQDQAAPPPLIEV